MAVLRKKIWFRYHLKIDKKISNVKEESRRKTDSNFDFFQAA